MKTRWTPWVCFVACLAALAVPALGEEEPAPRPIQLRCYGVPDPTAISSPDSLAEILSLRAYHDTFPEIQANSSRGLQLPGTGTMDMIPLMQIAGGIPEDCIYVNFRQSDTYIRQHKLLYPLDAYIESLVFSTPAQRTNFGHLTETGVLRDSKIPGGHLMDVPTYFKHLAKGENFGEFERRVPKPCYPVIFRQCPYEEKCEYLHSRGETYPTPKQHRHLWAFPIGPLVMGMKYRRDLFAEAGLPDRVPANWDEFFKWGKILTNPQDGNYGFSMGALPGWEFLTFLYSEGGRVVEQDEEGTWRCVFNSPAAVEAAYFMARIALERFQSTSIDGTTRTQEGILYRSSENRADVKVAMAGMYMDQRFFTQEDPSQFGFGPVPVGPSGERGSEFNSRMMGVYAGLSEDATRRDAAWTYIYWNDGPQARKIRTRVFVESGLGRFVNPNLLREHGYPEIVRQVPPAWEEAFNVSVENGVPEPYGENCQQVYDYPSNALTDIWNSKQIKAAIHSGNESEARRLVEEKLTKWVDIGNNVMLRNYTPEQMKIRKLAAWATVIGTVIAFGFVFYRVSKVFTPEDLGQRGRWQFRRFAWCYLLLVPAVGTILLWQYYPLARGTVMAFQNYNVRGFSQWVGMENFAFALFDPQFWRSFWISIKYAALYMTFAFFAPIFLAMLLQEVPKGKIFYRVIYYLPAVLTGAVVMFLWKSFYSKTGPVNQLVELFYNWTNTIFGTTWEWIPIDWLGSSTFALPFCLLPTIWAGMGPGCLIYLAALKTVPEEIYEAADIDGASVLQKVFHIAIPSIKVLIMINFIFALVGSIRGAGSFMLAMTGGGPAGATEVVGLTIFYTAFAKLNFGLATAQAWILGTVLIGFTVYQLKRLSQVEYRTATKAT